MTRLPPHVTWPAFIIALFAAGVLSTVSMLWIARSDGGAQVIEDYYARAVAWDDTAERRAASAALGWTTTIEIGPLDGADLMRVVVVVVRDSLGGPVEGLTGTVQAFRPQYASVRAEAALVPDPGRPGTYRLRMPLHEQGLWDLHLEARRDSALYLTRIRTEVSR